MGYYFDSRASAAALYGSAPEDVIRLMALRYMGDNPPAPFVWRAWNETGIQCDRAARYLFDFGRRFPEAPIGSAAFACGDLFCPGARASRFVITCGGPTVLWVNGEEVFRSGGAQERGGTPCEAAVSLRAGWNRFLLRCEATVIGFGCTLQNAMPQWEPCNYVLPYAERRGEAGFLYTAPLDPSVQPGEGVWGDREADSALPWRPEAETECREEGLFYGWTAWECPRGQKPAPLPGALVLVDGRPPREKDAAAFGRHEGLLWGTLSALRAAAAALPGRPVPPVKMAGPPVSLLILGPCDRPAGDPARLLQPGTLYRGAAWRQDRAHTALRPYVETPLFGRWTYPLGVTLYGLLRAGKSLKEPAFTAYVLRHVRQVTSIQAYALWDRDRWGFPGVNQQLCWLDALDDCGSFASLMLECDPAGADPAVRAIADRVGNYMLREQPRTPEGAFCRRDDTVWADDMYMSGPFLCRYAKMTGQREPLDFYAAQQLKYRDLLYLPGPKLMAHMLCLRHGKANGIPWCRGNGWVLFSLSELLAVLEPDHPSRPALLRHFNNLTEGYLALQDENGLWHQLLDEKETYPEASSTAMFICAFCRGARGGWYPPALRDRALDAAERGWRGLTEQAIDRNGCLYGVCRGSGFSFSRAYYRTLMWNFNDTHGIGIVMLAGVELLKTRAWEAGE